MSQFPVAAAADRLVWTIASVVEGSARYAAAVARCGYTTVSAAAAWRLIGCRLALVRFIGGPLSAIEMLVAAARQWQQRQARGAVTAATRRAERVIDEDWARVRGLMVRRSGQSWRDLADAGRRI